MGEGQESVELNSPLSSTRGAGSQPAPGAFARLFDIAKTSEECNRRPRADEAFARQN